MTTYYKATRPNGTDFRTGTVRYEVGQRTVHPSSSKRTKDEPSTYLSVSTHATNCTGMHWPCRLFVVEGVGRAMRSDQYPNKRAFLAVDVIEERPAHEVFGPQGTEVATLIDRASRLTAEEAGRLAAAWDAARAAPRTAPRTAPGTAAWDAAGTAAWAAAGAAVRAAVWDAAGVAVWDAAGVAVWDAAWAAAWAAARAAARALVVRDLIPTEPFDRLYGPWASVVGRDA